MSEINAYTMPPKVAGAVAAVMKAVPKLRKGEKNTHGNYNFASIDDFLEAVRPLCAEHGLIIVQDEESFEMRDGWLVMQFSFTLMHSSGETWGHKPRRTIMVSSKMGAQAFGAAQSYALKQFERSLFQIATGEKGNDADEHPPADLPDHKYSPQPPNHKAEKNTRSMDWHGPLTKTELRSEVQALVRGLGECMDPHDVDALVDEYAAVIEQVKKDLPAWWDEHDPAKPEFIPLETRVAQTRERLEGQLKTAETKEAESLEISPKGPGGWERFDNAMRDAIEGCSDIETLTRLQTDNAAHLTAYGEKFASSAGALMDCFRRRGSDLMQAPADG